MMIKINNRTMDKKRINLAIALMVALISINTKTHSKTISNGNEYSYGNSKMDGIRLYSTEADKPETRYTQAPIYQRIEPLISLEEFGAGKKADDVDWHYDNSDQENAQTQKKHNVSMNVSVKQTDKHVVATYSLKNNSQKTLYIWKPSIPKNGALYELEFNISSEKIILYKNSFNYNYGYDDSDSFLSLAPKETISSVVNLDRYYRFLPGRHLYDIGTGETCLHDKSPGPVTRSGYTYYEQKGNAICIRSNRVKIEIDSLTLNKNLYVNDRANDRGTSSRNDLRAAKGTVFQISGRQSPFSGLWEPLVGFDQTPIKIAKGDTFPQWKDNKGAYNIEWVLVSRSDGGPIILPDLYP